MKNNYSFTAWFYKAFENPKIYNFIANSGVLFNKRVKKYLPELIKVKPGGRILDVGCGTGRYADVFPCKYFGVDPSEDYIKYAKNHHQGNFLKMNGADLKFPDNTFDFVINISVLHHMPDSLVERTIAEMKRVCKKNGQIFIIDVVYPKKINFLGYLLLKFDRGKCQRTFGELENLLSRHCFRVVADDLGKTFPCRWSVFSYIKDNYL